VLALNLTLGFKDVAMQIHHIQNGVRVTQYPQNHAEVFCAHVGKVNYHLEIESDHDGWCASLDGASPFIANKISREDLAKELRDCADSIYFFRARAALIVAANWLDSEAPNKMAMARRDLVEAKSK